MKKLQLLALALFASLSLSALAQTLTLADITPADNWYALEGVGKVTNKSGGAFSDQDLSCDGIKGYKTGSSYFSMQVLMDVAEITIAAKSTSNRTVDVVSVSEELGSSAPSASNVQFTRSGGSADFEIPKNACDNAFTISFESTVPAGSYIQIKLSGNADIVAVTFVPAIQCEPADATFAAPESALNIEVGDEAVSTSLVFEPSENTSAVTYTVLKNGEPTPDATVENEVFTATAGGEFVVKAIQAYDGTYCQVVKEVTINVTDHRPQPVELFSLLVTSSEDVTISNGGTQQAFDAAHGVVTGGSAAMQNDHASKDQKVLLKSGVASFGAGTVTLVMNLDMPLEEGDIIRATGLTSEGLCFGINMNRADNLNNWLPSNNDAFIVPADFAGASILYAWRHSDSSTNLKSLSIMRPADDGSPKLSVSPASIDLNVTAEEGNPSATVKFSGKNLLPGDYSLTVPNLAGLELSEEIVTVDQDGKLNADITISFASQDEVEAASTAITLSIGELSAEVAVNYSASFQKVYGESINIEQLILDNGTRFDIAGELTAKGFDFANINALDSLNDIEAKLARNEPYLGLKLKKQGAYIACWLAAGHTIRVKFGHVSNDVLATIDGLGQAQTPDELAEGIQYTAIADAYMKIATTTDATVVIKQIIIDGEGFEPVELPAPGAYAVKCSAENGTLAANWDNKKENAPVGALITLTATPAEGYELDAITVNGVALEAEEGVYSFIMPAEEVAVVATFKALPGPIEGIDNHAATTKAVKRIVNGTMVIERNSCRYNAQGAQL